MAAFFYEAVCPAGKSRQLADHGFLTRGRRSLVSDDEADVDKWGYDIFFNWTGLCGCECVSIFDELNQKRMLDLYMG